MVSLYKAGLVGFGALAAVMLATSGDEAFVMLATIPRAALWIFGLCFVVGIAGGALADGSFCWAWGYRGASSSR